MPSLSLRKELQDFVRSCEAVLSVSLSEGNPPLTEDEIAVIEYYSEELRKFLKALESFE